MESLHKGFYYIWGSYSEVETYTLLEGFVWLRWAVTAKPGERGVTW